MAYREDQRWGALVGEHRTRALSWIAAALLGVAGTGFLGWFVVSHPDSPAMLKTVVGVIVMAVVTVWSVREWLRLSRIALSLYERGFHYRDGGERREVSWDDVSSVEAQYVPGMNRRGAGDERNLVGVTVMFPGGAVTFPKELRGFAAVVAEVRRRVKGPWRSVTIASLMHRR